MTRLRQLSVLVAGAGLAAVLAGALAGSAAADPTLTYGCNPPLPRTPANCSIWHTAPVTLVWSWDINSAPDNNVPGSDCSSPATFAADTTGTQRMCAVSDISTGKIANDTATIRIDATPPSVTGMTPSRPPDHDGWWNHPVSFAFTGSDATSGLASCDTVGYSGPDSDSAPISGSCHDVAGNSASAAFPIKYDATPPSVTRATGRAGDGSVAIKWTTSADVVATTVSRSPGAAGAPVTEVYSGGGSTFTDHSVRNGTLYRYTVTAADPAANTASATLAARPLPRLRWRPVRGAAYYNVQLYKGGRQVMSVWLRGTQLQLKHRWTFNGHRHVLSAGRYDWYAWPGYGRRSASRYGRLIVHRHFTVDRR